MWYVTADWICAIGVTLPLFEHYADGADSECVIVD